MLGTARHGVSMAAEFDFGSSYSAYHVTNNMAWATVPTAATWHHLAVTYDGSIEKTYVDGVLSVQSTSRNLNIWAGQPAFVGVAYDNSTGTTKSQWFSGSMTNLQVYDEALTQDEVRNIATVTISGQVTGPTGAPDARSHHRVQEHFKNDRRACRQCSRGRGHLYYGRRSGRLQPARPKRNNSYYLAAWKDGYSPSDDIAVTADISKTVDIQITEEAGVNLALGRTVESGSLYASPTGLNSNSVNNGFDGNTATYFSWTTSSQKDLVIDISKSGGIADSIDGVTIITSSLRAYDWELWTENNAAPISGGTRNASANWTKVYQSTGSFGGYDRTGTNGTGRGPGQNRRDERQGRVGEDHHRFGQRDSPARGHGAFQQWPRVHRQL